MIDAGSTHRLAAYGLAFVTLLLGAVPLPHTLNTIRPDALLLTVIWFALMTPRSTRLFFAFSWGLLLDAFSGVVLGEHALAFVAVAFLVHRFHLRMRMFPRVQQSLVVLTLLWIYQFLLFWVDGVSGHPVNEWSRLLPGLTGMLCWPLLSAFYSHIIRHR